MRPSFVCAFLTVYACLGAVCVRAGLSVCLSVRVVEGETHLICIQIHWDNVCLITIWVYTRALMENRLGSLAGWMGRRRGERKRWMWRCLSNKSGSNVHPGDRWGQEAAHSAGFVQRFHNFPSCTPVILPWFKLLYFPSIRIDKQHLANLWAYLCVNALTSQAHGPSLTKLKPPIKCDAPP